MARRRSSHPTDVELEILQILWEMEPAPLGEIVQAMQQQRKVAKTTVATMLTVMLEKKLISRKRGPQGYEWSARVSRDSAADGILSKLLDGVFDGSASRLVAHLVSSRDLSDSDLQELRRLIEAEGDDQSTRKKTTRRKGRS